MPRAKKEIGCNMEYLNLKNMKTDLILNTPNRNEILKDGPPENSKFNILGRGSYGVVFKAVYRGKQVAVKVMKNVFTEKADAMKNEGNILGWRHRNIVQLLKIESTANYGIVIMERFPGQCLQIILDSIKLPLEHRIHIAMDVANALIYCHRREILHLDVKPQNVLVAFSSLGPAKRKERSLRALNDRKYICKLCDFGSSVAMSEGKENTRRRIQGTVRYMSPEALREENVTPAADVFSLGVMMWQLKSRQLPYSWIECNESVAYQVVKSHLRPNAKQSSSVNVQLVVSSHHENCLCEHFSSEISYSSLDHIRSTLQKTKTLSPFPAKTPENHQRSKKLKNHISRSLIGAFQNTFVGFDKNTLGDFSEKEVKDEFSLRDLFRKKPVVTVPHSENLYEELFVSCWHTEASARPKAIEVKRRLLNFFQHKN